MTDTNRHTEQFEREELVRALQARERFLTGVLGSLESFVTIDDAWRITFANETAARFAGAAPGELIGVDVRELTPTELMEQALPALLRALNEQVTVEFAAEMPGHESSFRGRAYPLADGGLAVYLRDVTEEVHAALEREESEQRYRELVESVHSAILRWTSEGILIFMNDYAEQLFGWDAEEILGRRVSMLLPEPDPGSDASHLAAHILEQPERYQTNINENVRKDGSRLWMAWTNHAIRDEHGEVLEVHAVGNDITELVRAQSALQESEERFRTLADQSPFLIWVTGVDGGIEFVNRTYLEFFGVDEEDVTGSGWTPLVHPDDFERYADAFMTATRERRPFACEARVCSASGEWRWVDSHGVPRLSSSGEFLGMVGSSPDVTERRRTEEALRRTEAEKAAQQERIRLARDLHDSVTQALFAATLKAEALTAGGDRARVDAIAEEVRRLNRGALAQMRTLLLELRGDALEEVPLAQLLGYLSEAAESRASIDVWLTIDCRDELVPAVHVAVYRITQEALDNVVRHAGAANAWVDLSADASEVLLTVRDDGQGFDAARRDPSHLGLTLMRARAEEVGGRLTLESQPGGGTLVRFDWNEPEAAGK